LIDTAAHIGPPENPTLIDAPQAPEDGRIINGLFAQYQRPLSDSLALTLGLRRDDYSDFGAHLSPRVGLVQQLGAKDTLKFLYSEAFRAPSRIETSVINSGGFEQNPNLLPETAKTAELVWLHILASGYVASTLFNTQVQDAIVETVTPALKRSWGNSQQSVAGLELEWQNQWSERWQSRIAITHMLNPVGFMHTESNTVVGGSVSYQAQHWGLAFIANYQDDKRDPNEQQVPADITSSEYTDFDAFTLYGMHLNYLLAKDAELYLHADNLFNKNYLLPANRPANFVGVPNSGRVVSAGLRWAFN
jgi:outer membrane receptor protein involved in Fe transport